MLNALTRARHPSYHRATMLRLLIAALLLYWFWEPIRPIRTVTGEALSTAAHIIRR
jgi:hypothetical protein